MFVLINGELYNTYLFSSFVPITENHQEMINDVLTDVTVYKIQYNVINGSIMIQVFPNSESFDAVYSSLLLV